MLHQVPDVNFRTPYPTGQEIEGINPYPHSLAIQHSKRNVKAESKSISGDHPVWLFILP
ncbi:hypothetical protein NBG4_1020006 [Candidatus Sulfobium mesophilum]|uniref:Uncharacterized protein n=1 Tax=Candidatus Sulfobium mesophilum TaxID=2016548 RepID=A0A2U3QDZ3_9BACT|nr:hypothetical protein NBG4_1020006 [Candidatus Sulfobium mesophilum]